MSKPLNQTKLFFQEIRLRSRFAINQMFSTNERK